MAKPLAKLTGTFLLPRTSSNNRKYTKANIAKAVERGNQRLSSGGLPITMNSSHKATASGDVTATGAVVTRLWQEADGSGKFEANVVDTATGRDIAALSTPDEDGNVALKGVSIFGRWHGKVRNEDGAETADDLEITGIDFTHYPGVEGAGIDDAQLAEMAAAGLFGESIEEVAFVDTDTLEIPIAEDGLPARAIAEAKDPKKPYGDVAYADLGYQADGVARYPLDTEKHVRAGWAFVNMPKNAKKYSPAQLSRVKAKIKRAAKKLGIDIAAEMEAFESDILEVLEAYASMSLYNGQGQIGVSGSTDEPAQLKALAQRVALAAVAGLDALDPDSDGDIDLDPDDTPECEACDSPLSEDANFCPKCGHSVSEAAPLIQPKEAIMAEHTSEQVKALLTTEQAATLDPAKESYTSEEVQALINPPVKTKESGDPKTAALEALLTLIGINTESAAPGEKVKKTKEQKLEAAKALVAEAEAEQAANLTPAQIIEAASKVALEALRAEAGLNFKSAPFRKGLVAVEGAGERPDSKELKEMDADTFSGHYAATIAQASTGR